MEFCKTKTKIFLLTFLFLGLFGSSLFGINSGIYRIKRVFDSRYLTWDNAGYVSPSASNNTVYQKWNVKYINNLFYFIQPYGDNNTNKYLSATGRTCFGQICFIGIEWGKIQIKTVSKVSSPFTDLEKWVIEGQRIRSLGWDNTYLGQQGDDEWEFEPVSE